MGAQEFVGLQNFIDTLTNSLFQSAACNTIIFIVLFRPPEHGALPVPVPVPARHEKRPAARHYADAFALSGALWHHRVLLEGTL